MADTKEEMTTRRAFIWEVVKKSALVAAVVSGVDKLLPDIAEAGDRRGRRKNRKNKHHKDRWHDYNNGCDGRRSYLRDLWDGYVNRYYRRDYPIDNYRYSRRNHAEENDHTKGYPCSACHRSGRDVIIVVPDDRKPLRFDSSVPPKFDRNTPLDSGRYR